MPDPQQKIHATKQPHGDGKVSIFTVSYNSKDTLQCAIDSVRAQTYEQIEYIVVDGQSDDGSIDIIEANQDVVDTFISEPDDGIYDAMNKALELCSGDYIVILNSDDHLLPDFVEKSVRNLQENGGDISYCDYLSETGEVKCSPLNSGIYFTQLKIKHNTFLAKKSAYERTGHFDASYSVVADAKWIRTAYQSGLEFRHIEEPLIFYSSLGV